MFLLETNRLILRELKRSDTESLHKIFSDPLLMRFWPVFKGGEEIIDDCGMLLQEAEGITEVGIGWHLRRDLWGQGLATEAAQACRDYGFDRFGLDRLIALIHSENSASRRVGEKTGLTLRKLIQHRAGIRCLYVIEHGEQM